MGSPLANNKSVQQKSRSIVVVEFASPSFRLETQLSRRFALLFKAAAYVFRVQ